MINDYKNALTRYNFLIETLKEITEELEVALKEDNRWFSFGPRIARKFLNQAYSLSILFHPRIYEQADGQETYGEDISSMYSVLRMQFETHAAFYHFFVPCENIEENILRFRLWELDGLKSRTKFRRDKVKIETNDLVNHDIAYIKEIEKTIQLLPYFKSLPEKQQKELLEKSLWKFSSQSLLETDKRKWNNSINKLILNTGIKENIYHDLYSYLSMHTHPQYIGVIQNELSTYESDMMRCVTVMNACFVTAFLVEDLAKRYVQPKEHLAKMEPAKFNVLQSILKAGRNY